jgi:heterogeneous nuclear ribonucleoprotein K
LDLLISRIAEILKDEIMKSGIRRKEGETELRILVQSSQAGAIIGTKGSTVKTLRESTGSRININPECCPNSTERVAAIMGRPDTVVKCISMIYDILEKVPPKGSEQRYDPNCFDSTYDYGGKLTSGL